MNTFSCTFYFDCMLSESRKLDQNCHKPCAKDCAEDQAPNVLKTVEMLLFSYLTSSAFIGVILVLVARAGEI